MFVVVVSVGYVPTVVLLVVVGMVTVILAVALSGCNTYLATHTWITRCCTTLGHFDN